MRKIPTLFLRDPEDMSRLLREVHPACQWVADGEGVATRKYDGTCVLLDNDDRWWARREVKPGKAAPHGFVEVQTDDVTGKRVGWEPIEASPFVKQWQEAVPRARWAGTYELCGPKINGNPQGYDIHLLVRHIDAETLAEVPRTYDALAEWLPRRPDFEGVVWHHADGRMAKIKRRDFPQQ